jgi:hypothetical protein
MKPAAIMLAAWLLPLAAVAEEWKVYSYPEAGFAIQFPVPPRVEKGSFRNGGGASLPLTHYSAREDGSVFTLDVVDFSSTSADPKSTITQTEKFLGATGKVSVALDARIAREYGRELSLTGTDGSRSAIAIFFVNKHLYTLIGESLPPNAIQRSGAGIRFQESLQFAGGPGFPGGNGGFGRSGGPGPGRFNPQAQSACNGKAAGDVVQLDLPQGPVPATCTLIARPIRPPGPPDPDGAQNRPPPP